MKKLLALTALCAALAVAVLSAAASYPSTTKSFTTKTDGTTIQASHINDIQDEIVAIESALLGTLQHDLRLASLKYLFANGRSVAEGRWTAVTFAESNFQGDGVDADWSVDSGDVTTFAYAIVGDTMTVAFVIAGTDVGSNVADLQITIPASKIANRRMDSVITLVNAGVSSTATQGSARVTASGTTISVSLNSGGNWTATTSDNTNVVGQITFEIQ